MTLLAKLRPDGKILRSMQRAAHNFNAADQAAAVLAVHEDWRPFMDSVFKRVHGCFLGESMEEVDLQVSLHFP